MSALLEVTGVTKRYPGVVANDNVSLTVNAGEVVALLGENGAGKSTLLKAVFGLIKPDSGEIKIGGTPIVFGDTAGVISRGVGMVHQHFQLVPVMTVAENLILGDEPKRGLFINHKAARAEIIALSKRYGLEVDPDAVIEDLPVGMQQRVEILKALRKDVKLLILDEPTAVLTPQETNEAGLAQMMVGRSVVLQVNRTEAKRGAVVLEVKGLQVRDDRKILSVKGVDLVLHKGEILGVAGVEGNGQREFVEAICGMRHREAGEVLINGVATKDMAPHSVHEAGISHVPEDREKHGLVANYSIADNLVLNQFDQAPFAKGWVRNLGEVAKNAEQLVEKFDIRTPSAFNQASSLSGGNKQKVVVARELSQELPVLVAAQPTRGVDVGSIEFIHNQLISARDNGAGVLLVSAELDEILSLSDRIAVMSGGKIVAIVDSKDADRNYIGRLMAGLKE